MSTQPRTFRPRATRAERIGIAESLSADIAELQQLDLEKLRRRWRAMAARPVPAHLGRHLLVRLIAYRMQVQAHRDLDVRAKRLLDGMAKGISNGSGPSVPPRPDLRPLLPGTHLVREHDGIVHRAIVLEEGFAWNGTTYRSLSQLARAITGTRWNGHRFFGLKDKGEGQRRRQRSGGEAPRTASVAVPSERSLERALLP